MPTHRTWVHTTRICLDSLTPTSQVSMNMLHLEFRGGESTVPNIFRCWGHWNQPSEIWMCHCPTGSLISLLFIYCIIDRKFIIRMFFELVGTCFTPSTIVCVETECGPYCRKENLPSTVTGREVQLISTVTQISQHPAMLWLRKAQPTNQQTNRLQEEDLRWFK